MSLDDTFDFLNTIELESGSLVDRFTTFDDVAAWLIERGVCHSGRGPAALRPTGIDDDAALGPRPIGPRGPARRCPRGEPRPARRRRSPSPRSTGRSRPASGSSSSARPTACRSATATSAIRSTTRWRDSPIRSCVRSGPVDADRIRVCANDTCRWVFFDESRGRSAALVRHGVVRQPGQGGPPPRPGQGPATTAARCASRGATRQPSPARDPWRARRSRTSPAAPPTAGCRGRSLRCGASGSPCPAARPCSMLRDSGSARTRCSSTTRPSSREVSPRGQRLVKAVDREDRQAVGCGVVDRGQSRLPATSPSPATS